MVEAEEPAEAFATPDLIARSCRCHLGLDQLVGEALMTAFAMMMEKELAYGSIEGPATEKHQAIQALILDGAHPAIRVWTAVG